MVSFVPEILMMLCQLQIKKITQIAIAMQRFFFNLILLASHFSYIALSIFKVTSLPYLGFSPIFKELHTCTDDIE